MNIAFLGFPKFQDLIFTFYLRKGGKIRGKIIEVLRSQQHIIIEGAREKRKKEKAKFSLGEGTKIGGVIDE